MNVIEEATKRVKSNAPGIGAASRNAISKDVHGFGKGVSAEGKVPRRAKS
jgi:hypothetical protein